MVWLHKRRLHFDIQKWLHQANKIVDAALLHLTGYGKLRDVRNVSRDRCGHVRIVFVDAGQLLLVW